VTKGIVNTTPGDQRDGSGERLRRQSRRKTDEEHCRPSGQQDGETGDVGRRWRHRR
jgi:hypothetical protein